MDNQVVQLTAKAEAAAKILHAAGAEYLHLSVELTTALAKQACPEVTRITWELRDDIDNSNLMSAPWVQCPHLGSNPDVEDFDLAHSSEFENLAPILDGLDLKVYGRAVHVESAQFGAFTLDLTVVHDQV